MPPCPANDQVGPSDEPVLAGSARDGRLAIVRLLLGAGAVRSALAELAVGTFRLDVDDLLDRLD